MGFAKIPDPSGISSSTRAQGRDSSSDPLLVFGPPTRLDSSIPPPVSRPWAPLLGFSRPYSARGEESPRPVPVARNQPPGCYPGSTPALPSRQLRCRSQVFPTSQRRSSSLHPPAIFRRVALMGLCPSGVCSFSTSPATRRRRLTLVTFLPRLARVPVLGGDHLGRTNRIPRVTGCGAFGRLQGLDPSRNRSASPIPFIVSATDLPLLGFHLLMVCTTARRPSFRRM